jgi:peptidoglycan/xylan/chitin deacetylase (PgdA/CDA1 family)
MLARCTIGLLLAALAATLCACESSATAPAPPSAIPAATATPAPAIIVSRGNASRPMVALTFDTGDDAGRVTEILDVLQRESVRATFAIGGYWAEQHRDVLLAITAAGHEVINATYHGDSLTGASTGGPPLTAAQRTLELSRTEVTVYHLSQRSTRPYFRPPYGDVDASVQRDAAASGYGTIVLWTYDTRTAASRSPDAITQAAVAAAEPGAIYAMHADSAANDASAMAGVIDGLRAAGYTFGAIEDVLAR